MARRSELIGVVLLIGVATACSSSGSSSTNSTTCGATTPATPVEAGLSPTAVEDPTGKICNQSSWHFQSNTPYRVAVWLRETSLPTVPDCPGDASREATCISRDDVLSEGFAGNITSLVDGISTSVGGSTLLGTGASSVLVPILIAGGGSIAAAAGVFAYYCSPQEGGPCLFSGVNPFIKDTSKEFPRLSSLTFSTAPMAN